MKADQHIPARDAIRYFAEMANDFAQEPLVDAFNDCSVVLNKAVSSNFTRGGSPDGAWPKRKHHGHPTRDKGRSGFPGHPLLIDLGDLYAAATQDFGAGHIKQVEPRKLTVGVDGSVVPYASVHNEGGGRIPQREFFVVGDEAVDACQAIIGDAVESLI